MRCVCSICVGETTIVFTACLVLLFGVWSSCAQQESKERPIRDLVEPDGYISSTSYPLFIVMNDNPRSDHLILWR